jgi:hypothetical protein
MKGRARAYHTLILLAFSTVKIRLGEAKYVLEDYIKDFF